MASATTPDSLLSSLSKHFTHDEKIHTSSPPYSFATDLLGSFEKARKNHTQTLKVLEELAIMIKGRAAVEEVYSQQMARLVSDHTHGLRRLGEALARKAGGGGVNEGNYVTETSSCTIESTFRECVESLKADMLNRSVQRKQLAKNILADVFAPLEDIYDRLASESRGLEDLLGTLTKQGRACESRYRSAHKKYEQAVQLATNACDILTEKGQSLPSLDIQLLHQQYSNSSRAASSATPSPFDLKKEDFSAILAESPRKISEAFTQAAKKDITTWLLPLDKGRRDDLDTIAKNHLEMAELFRFACLERFDELSTFARRAAHELQRVLCHYQSCEERCIERLAVVLRKQIVFESSCLANEQFEAQIIFKVIEAMDKDKDLEAFIHAHKVPFPGADVDSTLKSLGLIGNPLPAPPAPPEEIGKTTCDENLLHASGTVIIGREDLPHLSSPAPRVVPATTVLRLLGGNLSASGTPTPTPHRSSTLRTTNGNPFSDFSSMLNKSLRSPLAAALSSKTAAPPPHAPSQVLMSPPVPEVGLEGLPFELQAPPSVRLGNMVEPTQSLDDEGHDSVEDEVEEGGNDEAGFSALQKQAGLLRGFAEEYSPYQGEGNRSAISSPLIPLEEIPTADGGIEYRL